MAVRISTGATAPFISDRSERRFGTGLAVPGGRQRHPLPPRRTSVTVVLEAALVVRVMVPATAAHRGGRRADGRLKVTVRSTPDCWPRCAADGGGRRHTHRHSWPFVGPYECRGLRRACGHAERSRRCCGVSACRLLGRRQALAGPQSASGPSNSWARLVNSGIVQSVDHSVDLGDFEE